MNVNLSTSISQYKANFSKPPVKATFEGWSPATKNAKKINQIVDLIKSPEIKRIAVLGHSNPDDDAVSSSLAINQMLKSLGKDSDVILEEVNKVKYSHLSGFKDVKFITKNSIPFINQKRFGNYDLVITVDTPNKSLLPKGLIHSVLKNAKHTVKIDHHPIYKATDDFADINLVDTDLSSAAQLVMQFAKPLNFNMTKEHTDILLTGMLGDTSNFKFQKNPVTDESDRLLLLSKGSDQNILYKKITDYNLPADVVDFSNNLTKQIKASEDKNIKYVLINDKDAEKINNSKNLQINLSKIKNTLFKTMGKDNHSSVQMIVTPSKDYTSFQIHSDNIDLTDVYKQFNIYQGITSGGHPRAGIVRIPGNVTKEKLDTILTAVNKQILEQTAVVN